MSYYKALPLDRSYFICHLITEQFTKAGFNIKGCNQDDLNVNVRDFFAKYFTLVDGWDDPEKNFTIIPEWFFHFVGDPNNRLEYIKCVNGETIHLERYYDRRYVREKMLQHIADNYPDAVITVEM